MPSERKFPRWAFHIDHPWAEDVRDYGAPLRIYAWIPAGHIEIALTPGSKVQKYDRKAHRWTDEWGWWRFLPRDWRDHVKKRDA